MLKLVCANVIPVISTIAAMFAVLTSFIRVSPLNVERLSISFRGGPTIRSSDLLNLLGKESQKDYLFYIASEDCD